MVITGNIDVLYIHPNKIFKSEKSIENPYWDEKDFIYSDIQNIVRTQFNVNFWHDARSTDYNNLPKGIFEIYNSYNYTKVKFTTYYSLGKMSSIDVNDLIVTFISKDEVNDLILKFTSKKDIELIKRYFNII